MAAHPDTVAHPDATTRHDTATHPDSAAHPNMAAHSDMTVHPDMATHPGMVARPDSAAHPNATTPSDMTMHPDTTTHPGTVAHPMQDTSLAPHNTTRFTFSMPVQSTSAPFAPIPSTQARHTNVMLPRLLPPILPQLLQEFVLFIRNVYHRDHGLWIVSPHSESARTLLTRTLVRR